MGHKEQIEDEGNRPKWLLELENRKRKPRLAHELGAGAPCIKCTSSCPGLDLHFWRKVCKNCKCSRDDHDVPDEDFPQFDLLFGPSGTPKRKAIVLKRQAAEETFEWAPPDTTKELAADYMKALPEEKLPIKGTAGAALRKQQLQKQLPLHDIDHKVCDELSDSERKQFEKYLENLKKYVGQGKVTKFTTAKPFDKALMTPANASECFSPKHKPAIVSGNSPNLRTPSSFVPKKFEQGSGLRDQGRDRSPDPAMTLGKREIVGSPAFNHSSSENSKLGRYHHVLGEVRADNQVSQSTAVPGIQNQPINLPHQHTNDLNQRLSQSKPIESRIHNVNSPESRLAHSSVINKPANHALNFAQSNIHNETTPACLPQFQRQGVKLDFGVSDDQPLRSHQWAKKLGKSSEEPQEENSILAEKMLTDALLPPSSINSNDIVASTLDRKGLSYIREKLASKYGEREEEFQRQSPMKSREFSNSPRQKAEFKAPGLVAGADMTNKPINPQLIASGGVNPTILHSILPAEGQSPMISREFNNVVPRKSDIKGSSLSAGSEVNTKPINQQMITSGGLNPTIIHSETLQTPVFPESSVGAMRTLEHPQINNLAASVENIMSLNTPKQKCYQCAEEIMFGDVIVTADKAKDAAWHPGCFVCSICNELLVDLVYIYQKGKLYCGRDFAALLQIPRCFACDELIFVREYTVAEGHNYHIKHFCCWDCDKPLAGQQYVTENDRPLCLPCFQKTYAKTCSACQKVIAADQIGAVVKNLNFHATDECFCCANCRKSLINGKMAIKEDKLFCSKVCISELLNKK